MGVDRARIKTRAFACSAAYAGVAGSLFAFALGFVAPESFTLVLSFAFLAAMVIGGLGSVIGPLLGALFIEFVPQYAERVNQALTGVLYGVALIVVMYLLPGGAAGLLRRLRALLLEVVEGPPPQPQRRDRDGGRKRQEGHPAERQAAGAAGTGPGGRELRP